MYQHQGGTYMYLHQGGTYMYLHQGGTYMYQHQGGTYMYLHQGGTYMYLHQGAHTRTCTRGAHTCTCTRGGTYTYLHCCLTQQSVSHWSHIILGQSSQSLNLVHIATIIELFAANKNVHLLTQCGVSQRNMLK